MPSHTERFVNETTHADVCVIIVTYNSGSDIEALIRDLRHEAQETRIRVVVADNQSADGTLEIVRQHDDVIAIDTGGNLGYAGGINAAHNACGDCDSLLILNPDLRVRPGSVAEMLATMQSDSSIGAVVPSILDSDGSVYPSLRFEPSVTRMFGDALFGRKLWTARPSALSEFDYRPASYERPHNVDWATGAALMIPADVADRVGPWNEEYFLYSEEIEYFRRIREQGKRIRYQPAASVAHELGGSGTSPALGDLLAVNRVRYFRHFHSRLHTSVFRILVALTEFLRAYDPTHRRRLGIVLNCRSWEQLPKATRRMTSQFISGSRQRGSVIVPAYNEAAVIEQTLTPLSQAAVDGYIELIVVCNGCTDDTAERARQVPGTVVVEIPTGSKPLALNIGDETATLWPRLYLDADIEITSRAVLSVLDRLDQGDVLAARPSFRYGLDDADAVVRSYYRARARMPLHRDALWWAGVYGLNKKGHDRFGPFPDVTGDDKFVDSLFSSEEKTVVDTDPSVWTTPTTTAGLLTVLTRHHRGNAELAERNPAIAPKTGGATASAVVKSVRGARSAVDAAVYLALATIARYRAARSTSAWERDDSSRTAR
ncbi:glycosyltransferase [Gordonia sp. CPCC 205515]|uniref:glycosyltransferase family 2 protein n=1 Tax=Gordonia sp. CPCC 205515 TaxID=3140791 RepID=UPI003AF3B785